MRDKIFLRFSLWHKFLHRPQIRERGKKADRTVARGLARARRRVSMATGHAFTMDGCETAAERKHFGKEISLLIALIVLTEKCNIRDAQINFYLMKSQLLIIILVTVNEDYTLGINSYLVEIFDIFWLLYCISVKKRQIYNCFLFSQAKERLTNWNKKYLIVVTRVWVRDMGRLYILALIYLGLKTMRGWTLIRVT